MTDSPTTQRILTCETPVSLPERPDWIPLETGNAPSKNSLNEKCQEKCEIGHRYEPYRKDRHNRSRCGALSTYQSTIKSNNCKSYLRFILTHCYRYQKAKSESRKNCSYSQSTNIEAPLYVRFHHSLIRCANTLQHRNDDNFLDQFCNQPYVHAPVTTPR